MGALRSLVGLARALWRGRYLDAALLVADNVPRDVRLSMWLVGRRDKGFVYLLSNADVLPGRVKCGISTDPRRRAAELRTAAVPSPFTIELVCPSANMIADETKAHRALATYRVGERHPTSRRLPEIFEIDVPVAIEIVMRALDLRDEHVYRRRPGDTTP